MFRLLPCIPDRRLFGVEFQVCCKHWPTYPSCSSCVYWISARATRAQRFLSVRESISSSTTILIFLFDILGTKLTLDDLGQVMEEVLDVSTQWYHLALQLKVRTGTLDRIRTQFHDPRDQLLEMLKSWLTTSDNTSWKILTDALRSRSVGASQLAGVLETKYCLMENSK